MSRRPSPRPADGPRPLSASLAKVAGSLTVDDADQLTHLANRWAELVGEDVAAHARVLKVLDGVVTVAVDDPSLVTALRLDWPGLTTRASELGLRLPPRLEVVTRGR